MEQIKTHKESLGWAFLLAWVFCMFYTGSLDGLSAYADLGSRSTSSKIAVSILPVSFAIVALVFAVALERKYGTPASKKTPRIACPLLTALGTVLICVPVHSPLAETAHFTIASATTGIGSGLMWVMWGEHYARLTQEAVETCAPMSALLAALLSLIAMLLPDAASWVCIAFFAIAAGVTFSLAWNTKPGGSISDQTSTPASPGPLGQAASSMGRAGFGILAACLFVSLEGSFYQTGGDADVQISVIFILSAAFMLVVGTFATAGPRRVTLAYAYRWMCPLMIAGFAALIVFGDGLGSYLAAVVGIASRFAFCLITQMYFASLAARGAATPVQAYGMGWIFVHAGDLLGVCCTIASTQLIACGYTTLTDIASLSSVLMAAAMMFALGGERFLEWELPSQAAASGRPPVAAGLKQQAASAQASQTEAIAYTSHEAHAAQTTDEERTSGSGTAPASSAAGAQPAAAQAGVASAAGSAAASTQPAAARQAAAQSTAAAAPADPLATAIEELSDTYKLTKREREVFALLAHGRSVPYIRDALIISKDTAATHTKHIYAKLGVHSRQELISMVEGGD